MLKSLSLLTTASEASISAVSIEGTATEPYRPGRRQDPETAELYHRKRGRRGELRAMIKIDIFKENHRSSN
jgi:hypothetical protein